MTTTTASIAPYTVRTLGGVSWADGISTLTAAVRSLLEARDRGLRNLAIVDGNGRTVDPWSEEMGEAEFAEEESR